MSISVDYLHEPKLLFGKYFEHQDTKTGLAEFGPFGKNIPGLHPSEVKVGFIGTRETISGAKEWLEECGSEIESENAKTIKAKIAEVEDRPNLFGEGIFDDEHIHEPLLRLYKILAVRQNLWVKSSRSVIRALDFRRDGRAEECLAWDE